MKQILLLLGLAFASVAFSQEKSNEEVRTVVEEDAEFPGGISAMMTFLGNNLNYYSVDGKLILRFVVDTDGKISKVKVEKALDGCRKCSKNAIKVVKSMPRWTPGKVNGKVVRSYFSLPISYRK